MTDEATAEVTRDGIPLRGFGAGLVVLGAIGLLAAFTLTADKIRLLEDPSFVPACNINPILSCGSVMVTDQASALGFPNPMLGLSVGSVAGLVFVHWLAFQSLYRINALCPWCMVVWSVTIPLALWSALVALRLVTGNGVVRALWSVRYLIVVFWYLVLLVLILVRFWDYWSTL